MSLPAADDLFRPTAVPAPETADEPGEAEERPAAEAPNEQETGGTAPGDEKPRPLRTASRRPSGRVRHDEKMTVYVTADELLDLEHARLLLRRDHGLAVDRGRFVREAVALALADLDDRGGESVIVQRLKQV